MRPEPELPLGAKRRDYWWTVLFTDPIALPLVRLLARKRWFTPDQISIVALVMALGIGPLFALGTRTGFVAGGILFYVTFLVDCVDGKLARALAVSSERGAALDDIGDGARRASSSLGLLIGLWRADAGETVVAWAIAYVVCAYYFKELSGAERPIEKTTRPVEELPPPRGPMGKWAAALARRRMLPTPGMPDVQAIVFVVGPVGGIILACLIVGTALVGAGILVSAWRRLR